MRITLVGADCEENLGLGMVAASLLGAGHEVVVVAFDAPAQLDRVAERVLGTRPDVIGLGLQFQFRSREFAALAEKLRERGFRGHLTAGGQHASLAHAPLLTSEPALDSIVLFEGETTLVELVAALAAGTPLALVPGLALRDAEGAVQTQLRPLHADLDALPLAHRYRPPARHLGLPFIPMSGSRGCWRSCAFCSITSYYRAAREAGGRLVRLRSVDSLAEEMAKLHHATGSGTSLFCFHDDSLLLPRSEDTITRLSSLRRALRERGVDHYGLIGKCRPDTITTELARELRALGVIRMLVGIENASQPGLDHLDRQTTTETVDRALFAFQQAGIFATYNLLLFEPDATLDDVRQNARFLRRHAGAVGNFCRAEPFHGTPLHHRLTRRGLLFGDHHGWDYRIADDRVELLFRLTLAAFRERNYATAGVGNRHLALAYMTHVLHTFVDAESPRARRAIANAQSVVAAVAVDSAVGLEWAIDVVERLDPKDEKGAERAAIELAQRVTAQDRQLIRAIDQAMDEIVAVAAAARRQRNAAAMRRKPEFVQRVALAGALLASAACGGKTEGEDVGTTGGVTVGDGGFPPTSGGFQGPGGTAGTGAYVAGDGGFPPTGGASPDGGTTGGYIPGDGGFPPTGGWLEGTGGWEGPTGGVTSDTGGMPPTGGWESDTGGAPTGGWVSDTGGAPNGGGGAGGKGGAGGNAGVAGVGNVAGASAGAGTAGQGAGNGGVAGALSSRLPTSSQGDLPGGAVGSGRDTNRVTPERDATVALHTPPLVTLEGWVQKGRIRVVARGATPDMELYWSGAGVRDGSGSELLWTPTTPRDRLTLVVRQPGGVASMSLLAADANGA